MSDTTRFSRDESTADLLRQLPLADRVERQAHRSRQLAGSAAHRELRGLLVAGGVSDGEAYRVRAGIERQAEGERIARTFEAKRRETPVSAA